MGINRVNRESVEKDISKLLSYQEKQLDLKDRKINELTNKLKVCEKERKKLARAYAKKIKVLK